MSAGTLNNAGGDGTASGEVVVVFEHVFLVEEILSAGVRSLAVLAGESALRGALTDAGGDV